MEALAEGLDIKKRYNKPLTVLKDLLSKGQLDAEELKAALPALQDEKYLARQSSQSIQDFFLGSVAYICKGTPNRLRGLLKQALVNVSMPLTLLTLLFCSLNCRLTSGFCS